MLFQPFLRDWLGIARAFPALEALGYCRLPLRGMALKRFLGCGLYGTAGAVPLHGKGCGLNCCFGRPYGTGLGYLELSQRLKRWAIVGCPSGAWR